jgi:hypothetical protein
VAAAALRHAGRETVAERGRKQERERPGVPVLYFLERGGDQTTVMEKIIYERDSTQHRKILFIIFHVNILHMILNLNI